MPRFDPIHEYPRDLDGEALSVGIVMSRFNPDICEGLLAACVAELQRLGVAPADIEIATVPGALEIPLALQTMAQSDRFDALVALDHTSAAAPGRTRYAQHLAHTPSLVAAAQWLAHERLEHEEHHPHIQRALDQAARPLKRYRCAACGFEAQSHYWQCPGCHNWDSYPPRRIEEL